MGREKRFSPSIMKRFLLTFLLIHSPFLCLQAKHQGYSWKDEPGKHLDLLKGDRKIVRYVYERLDPEDRERTYKPFHHVYQADGKDFLTKGPGGKFTHHRGIYYGFSKCSAVNAAGKKVRIDTWHCKGGYQTHEKVIESKADDKGASHAVEIAWRVDDGTIFASEKRTLSFSHREDGSLQVDFSSVLSTKQDSVTLDGDPQHAGFQFRASNEVAAKTAKQTYYVRPKDGKDGMGKTKNWPGNKDMTNLSWKAQSVVVSDRRYFTVYLDHPDNPKPSFYSERDYGRFGSYFKSQLTPAKPVKIKYRLVIGTEERDPASCAALSKEFNQK
tara:strand:+ start:775 stop:1758 length:984 start_codon:yes stop_codon:yes gene_type:complete